jgi:competence ComEA-like helix-hairpin-helix protein
MLGFPLPSPNALAATLLVLISAGLLPPVNASPRFQTNQDPLPDGPGKPTVVVVCGSCHDVDTATGMRRTTAEWKEVVESMINRGAVASDDEIKAVLTYLSKTFGVVNVNKAAAKEIEDVLEIPATEAEAIVRQRTDRGAFASLDELKSVSGVDASSIEKRKERVRFK